MTSLVPHSGPPLEARDLPRGSLVHVQGIPFEVVAARVATHPANWRLIPVREVNTAAGHKAIHSDKWKRCTKKVTGAANKYAVCTKSLGKKSFKHA